MDKGNELLGILKEIKQEKETGMANTSQDKPPLIRETGKGREKYCPACKDYHPATDAYFYKDSNSTTGLTSWCKKATLAKQRRYNQKNKDTPGKPGTGTLTGPVLTLDFSAREPLLNEIRTAADRDFRTPEMQALWLISGALQTDQA